MNLFQLLTVRAGDGSKLALIDETSPHPRWTYGELIAEAEALAAGLGALGLGKGDRVALYLGNRVELVTLYLALLLRGAVLVPINLAYRKREIGGMLADAEPRLLVTERALAPVLDEVEAEERRSLERVILVEDLDELRGRAATAAEDALPRVEGSDLAMLLYTSGTTGRSKGAMISHDNVMATVAGLLAAWTWSPADRLLLTLPLFHTHGLVVGLHCALAAGATVELHRRFEAERVAEALLAGPATLFFGVPTMYVRLVEELRRLREGGTELSFPHVRLFCSGSAPLASETFDAFRELTGHDILERYGMTETGMLLSNPYRGRRRAGTVGTPLPGVSARIVDEAGAEVEDGTEGELWVAGSNVFRGYWQAPEKTRESFAAVAAGAADADGRLWFRTGDLARRDPGAAGGGAISLLGRRTELILSGGFNVYPREIEEVLVTYSGVREAAVVGRKDAQWGEVPVAYLVADSEIDPLALVAFCKSQMAGFKVPKAFERVESLPRNALGKVQKHLLGI
jgi:malonyl-CoA/methylmalonyl-CoA synthetase